MSDPLEIIGNTDLVGAFFYFSGKIPNIVENVWNTIVAFTGGNTVLAIIIIGMAAYVIIDIFFHMGIDNPTRRLGQGLSSRLIRMVVFLFILAIMSAFVLS